MSSPPEDEPYEVVRRWPPPGTTISPHHVTVEVGASTVHLEMAIPVTPGDSIELESAVVHRRGGPTPEDWAFRTQLHGLVGAIVVHAGHVEAAMKRLLLLLTGESSRFVDADHTWTDLESRLERAAADDDDIGPAVLEALAWACTRNLKAIRDHVVHGYIWDFADDPVRISRWKRRESAVTIIASMDELRRAANRMHDFARRLETPLHGRWLEVAIVPESELPDAAPKHERS